MQLQPILLLLGVGALYIGYAGVMGILIRRASHAQRRTLYIVLAMTHGMLLFLPASIVVLGLVELSLMVRLSLLALGLVVTAIGMLQPHWIPKGFWQRSFGLRYFAISMALAAFWCLGLGFTKQSLAPTILGTAASIACVVSLTLSPPDATSPLR